MYIKINDDILKTDMLCSTRSDDNGRKEACCNRTLLQGRERGGTYLSCVTD